MGSNATNAFLQSLANESRSSRTQSQILLARKPAERQRCHRKMRNLRDRMKCLTRELMTEEVNMAGIDEDVNRLTEDLNAGAE